MGYWPGEPFTSRRAAPSTGMTAEYVVQILHGVGFLSGVALYAMLLAMVLPGWARRRPSSAAHDVLPVVTGLLGLAWNMGAFVLLMSPHSPPALFAVAYSALGLLPAVFVHAAVSSWKDEDTRHRAGRWVYGLGYALAGAAALMQIAQAFTVGTTPSDGAFRVLALGFLVVGALMLMAAPGSARRAGGALWASALTLFGISAWHLGQHEAGAEGWPAVVLGHHASIPLALAILWLDFRFALADIFLKRALAVLAQVCIVATLYLGLFGAHAVWHAPGPNADPTTVFLGLALWTASALSYPLVRRVTAWFVDAVLLRRPDASELRAYVARRLVGCETPEAIVKQVTESLAPALSAGRVSWDVSAEPAPTGRELVVTSAGGGESGVTVSVPTAEPPHYVMRFEALGGGRRVLSDDVALLEAVALLAARRLDALRWLHERCERDLREELVAKLATEAELRALQAQLNPHFLFNALNTIGYLMRTAPDRAQSTLLDLTRLLRAVLKRSGGDVVTLGQEIELVESYLAIELARFEERLRLRIDVPADLRGLSVPPLLVQPLVENAIKHGIAPRGAGGEIVVSARTEPAADTGSADVLVIEVCDTGVGGSESAISAGRARGLGLSNVEKRLRAHYGHEAGLDLTSELGRGTRVVLRLPAGARARVLPFAAGGGS